MFTASTEAVNICYTSSPPPGDRRSGPVVASAAEPISPSRQNFILKSHNESCAAGTRFTCTTTESSGDTYDDPLHVNVGQATVVGKTRRRSWFTRDGDRLRAISRYGAG